MQNADYQKLTPPPQTLSQLLELTRQELKILELAVTEDFTNGEIAQKLNIQEATVKTHRINIYRKYRVHGRAEVRKFLRTMKKQLEKN